MQAPQDMIGILDDEHQCNTSGTAEEHLWIPCALLSIDTSMDICDYPSHSKLVHGVPMSAYVYAYNMMFTNLHETPLDIREYCRQFTPTPIDVDKTWKIGSMGCVLLGQGV